MTTLSERDSKALLAAFGIPLPAERFAVDRGGAADAASSLGYPVVVKLNGDEHRPQDRARPGAPRLGRPAGSSTMRRRMLLAAATTDDGDVDLLDRRDGRPAGAS